MSDVQMLRDVLAAHLILWDNRTDPSSDKWRIALGDARAALAQTTPTALNVSVPDDARDAARFRYLLTQASYCSDDYEHYEPVELIVKHNDDAEIRSWIDAAIAAAPAPQAQENK